MTVRRVPFQTCTKGGRGRRSVCSPTSEPRTKLLEDCIVFYWFFCSLSTHTLGGRRGHNPIGSASNVGKRGIEKSREEEPRRRKGLAERAAAAAEARSAPMTN